MSVIKKWIKKIKAAKQAEKLLKQQNALKASFAACGENLLFFGIPEISGAKNLSVGDNCKINSCVYINARSGVTVGNDVTLSHGAKIISTGYDIEHWMQTGEKIHVEDLPVHIGNHCWVGANAIILPGVKITGEYVVIGAGAVVTKDITESRVVVAGVPAEIIKRYE